MGLSPLVALTWRKFHSLHGFHPQFKEMGILFKELINVGVTTVHQKGNPHYISPTDQSIRLDFQCESVLNSVLAYGSVSSPTAPGSNHSQNKQTSKQKTVLQGGKETPVHYDCGKE